MIGGSIALGGVLGGCIWGFRLHIFLLCHGTVLALIAFTYSLLSFMGCIGRDYRLMYI
jgi:hypothetical protein